MALFFYSFVPLPPGMILKVLTRHWSPRMREWCRNESWRNKGENLTNFVKDVDS